jgi:hypothetical protein
MVQLRGHVSTATLCPSVSASARNTLGTIATKRDSVFLIYIFIYIMKLIDYKNMFCDFIGMLRRRAECYADVVLTKLSLAA